MLFELLEGRRLLAFAPWSINVNFQTPEAPSVPAGYLSDVGATYGRRPNGQTYGFATSIAGEAINRNDPRSPDERYDAFIYLRPEQQTWQVKVPAAGAYRVRVVAGDPKVFNSTIRVAAEHVIAVEGPTTSAQRWFDGTTTVSVTDGALTLTSAPGAVNNKLCFVEIARIEPPAAVPPPASGLIARPVSTTTNAMTWSDDADNETGFKIERKRGSLGQFEPVAIVGANVTSFVDTPLRAGTPYWYRVRAFNAAGSAAASNQDGARTFDSSGSSIVWEEIAPSPIQRAEALTATMDNKLYVFGGFNGNNGPVVRSDVYDPVTDEWTRIADLPRRLTHAGVAVDGRYVYFAGGYIGTGPGFQQQFGTEEVWRYHVDLQVWTRMPDLPAPLASGGLVALGRELHYFSGNDSDREDVPVHYVLNLDNPTSWSTAAALPSGRSHMGYLALGGKIYALGGQFGNDEELQTTNLVDVWDPASPSVWIPRASMPARISHVSSSTFVLNDRIVIAGGETDHGDATSSVLSYDPLSNTWSALTSLPAERFSGVARAIEGVLYFTTGSNTFTTYRGIFSA
jgi:N-acetylneuraminic acid mutarotase